MEKERIQLEKNTRTIQQRNAGSANIMDNRPSGTRNYLFGNPLQRTEAEEEEDILQSKMEGAVQRTEGGEEEDGVLQGKESDAAPRNETGLPDNLKAGVESLSGFSLDDVRVHYNSRKPATVQALAYTQGTDIHVAPGQEKHLPHEAWHVAQQMAGRVAPTTSVNGMPVNDNAALEHEADVMGAKAVQFSRENTGQNNLHGIHRGIDVKQLERTHNVRANVSEILSDTGPAPQYTNARFAWGANFDMIVPEFTDAVKQLTINVRIETRQLNLLFLWCWKRPIERKLNGRFRIKITDLISNEVEYWNMVFNVKKREGTETAHQTVDVGSVGTGRGLSGTDNMNRWGRDDYVDVTHEFGHMIGAKDEYGIVDGINYGAGRAPGGSVMNNPEGEFETRHMELICLELRDYIYANRPAILGPGRDRHPIRVECERI